MTADADVRLPALLQPFVKAPWHVKRWVTNRPAAWRIWAGVCRRLGWGPSRLGWHTVTNGPFRGIRLHSTHPNQLAFPMGTYEPHVAECLTALLGDPHRPYGTRDVWDVGANCGLFSLLCAAHTTGRVLAIEPAAHNLECLRCSLAGNPALADRIEPLEAAVGDRDGEVDLVVREAGAICQIVSPGVPLWDPQPGDRRVAVPAVRLDSLLSAERPAPGLVKIDVEGAEGLVLAGASRLLAEHHPAFVIELHDRPAAVDVLSRLRASGYQCSRVTPGGLVPLGPADEPQSGHIVAL